MDEREMLRLVDELLGVWNTQEAERVAARYTEDLVYRDPNTRGVVEGRDAFRRYQTKLFASWRMHWALREAHLFQDQKGCAVLWHASFQREGRQGKIEIDGMDLVTVRDGQIARNEVYFDRTPLEPLL
jgi:ketosteroid isomerase-like protein